MFQNVDKKNNINTFRTSVENINCFVVFLQSHMPAGQVLVGATGSITAD
jgi:hypothetical protein